MHTFIMIIKARSEGDCIACTMFRWRDEKRDFKMCWHFLLGDRAMLMAYSSWNNVWFLTVYIHQLTGEVCSSPCRCPGRTCAIFSGRSCTEDTSLMTGIEDSVKPTCKNSCIQKWWVLAAIKIEGSQTDFTPFVYTISYRYFRKDFKITLRTE